MMITITTLSQFNLRKVILAERDLHGSQGGNWLRNQPTLDRPPHHHTTPQGWRTKQNFCKRGQKTKWTISRSYREQVNNNVGLREKNGPHGLCLCWTRSPPWWLPYFQRFSQCFIRNDIWFTCLMLHLVPSRQRLIKCDVMHWPGRKTVRERNKEEISLGCSLTGLLLWRFSVSCQPYRALEPRGFAWIQGTGNQLCHRPCHCNPIRCVWSKNPVGGVF